MYQQPGRLNAQENDITKKFQPAGKKKKRKKQNCKDKKKQKQLAMIKIKNKKKKIEKWAYETHCLKKCNDILRCHCLQSFLVPQVAVFGNIFPVVFPKRQKMNEMSLAINIAFY